MKPLLTLTDKDISGEDTPDFVGTKRVAVRAIILDDKNDMALVGVGTHILPGGGVDEGESLEDAVHRECMEEVGCRVEILSYLGFTKDSRAKRDIHQTTHCYVTRVVGEKGTPTTTQKDEQEMMLDWLSPEEALALLKSGQDKYAKEHINFAFNIRSHIAFVEEYLKNI